ncbi:putative RING-H2 finger protein atl21a [Phtheirospermum japonicum]|uniref:Putative RING-H2 finger protein atl21a n=1 Tax=Phtheirospermum japonicum TaxID=374723 RepID=A0A830DAE5_9LAMI|nr:putative RING-H2 finger protein atl21a [Phtheirospermum japonicum]
MNTTVSPIILIFSTIFVIIPALSANPCKPDYCDTSLGPEIRFPFRLAGRAPARCGYPGFDLHCNSQNQTILTLPRSGEFVVDHIDYSAQALFINDPDLCLPARILNFSLSGSRFRGVYMRNYTFLNCSSDYMDYTSARYMPLLCLSGVNYTVLAMSSRLSAAAEVPPSCRRIASVLVPMQWTVSQFYWSSMDLREDLELIWSEPECSGCENQGGVCGYKADSGPEIGCYRPAKSGLPRGAKYGIIIGVGIPGLVCIIGLACYACGMIRSFALRGRLNPDLPTTFSDQRPVIRSSSGLDAPTIESYPTTILGESRRLPKTSDGTCPICLSDFQPKETLRSIPECNHYFHADCIDEWLKLNGTCPLCRNSPESSVATPCSSTLSISSPSSSSSSSMTSSRE